MGLRDSPYRSTQLLICLKIEAYGDRWDRSNIFHWEKVICNLPGTKGYRLRLPWVMKVRFNGHIACEIYVYMDNGWIMGHCRELCWAAGQRFAWVFQERSSVRGRKIDLPGRRPRTNGRNGLPQKWRGIIGTVSQEKWEMMQLLVGELADMVKNMQGSRGCHNEYGRSQGLQQDG